MTQIKVFTNVDPGVVEQSVNEWLALNQHFEILSIIQSESKRAPRSDSGGLMLRGARPGLENSSLTITVVYQAK